MVIKDLAEVERARGGIQRHDAEQHKNVADARGHEGFDGGSLGRRFGVPEANQ